MKQAGSIIIIIISFAWSVTISCSKNPVKDKFTTISNPQFDTVSQVLNSYMTDNKVTGGVALVYHNNELVMHKGFGISNLEQSTPFTNESIFRIASMTKPITSVAAMMLYEEGKFQLDDPISKYLPEFSDMQILTSINKTDSSYTAMPARSDITVSQLFTFSSGLYYGFDIDSLALIFAKNNITEGFEDRHMILEDNIKNLAKLPLLHEPGERYHYGLEMDVLGRLVEVWSGVTLNEFFEQRIFKPLGMNDTYFYLPEDKYKQLVPVYMNSDSGIVHTNYPLINYPVKGAKTYYSGGADLSSTAYDYFLFCKMMINKGELNGVRILKPETVDLISSIHLETGDEDMGLGFGLLSAKTNSTLARSVGSITWGGFFTTTFWIDPSADVIGILMLQMYPFNYWDIQKDFEDAIYNCL